MSKNPTDEQLLQALRELPHERASAAFTRRVMADLPPVGSRRRGRGRGRTLWIAAATSLAVLGLALGLRVGGGRPPEAATAAQELRLERDRLERELTALRDLAERSRPVIHLGGDEAVDFVFDPVAWESAPPAPASVRRTASELE